LPKRWVIFCRVVDNLGDAGVCWRLARQLASEYAIAVDLVTDRVDVLAQFQSLCTNQSQENIQLYPWHDADTLPIGEVTIAAFACRLPAPYQARLAQMQAHTSNATGNWFNLEYLCAQSWTTGTHLLESTHPDGSIETFFMPGFNQGTGGLLREKTLNIRSASARSQARQQWGFANHFVISLFCYRSAPLAQLLAAASLIGQHRGQPVVIVVNQSLAQQLQLPALLSQQQAKQPHWHSPLIQQYPFLSQDNFDQLLLAADLNCVRGEDSWVRAIWAGQPFLWQAYQQDNATTASKVNDFVAHWSQTSQIASDHPALNLFTQWNSQNDVQPLPLLQATESAAWHQWQQASQLYCDRLSQMPDLASQLVAASTTI
jgi:uncharacterized repeat protein (TIGR03837 family)